MQKLVRITTIPLSLEKLLEGQLTFMNDFYEVIAISAEKERLEEYGTANGVKTFWVEMTRAITPVQDLKAVWKLYYFLKKEKPLIVHTHTPKAGIVGMLAAKMAGVPIRLHTVAGLPLLETRGTKRKILDGVEKLTYKLATRIYPNSHGLKDIILNAGYAPKEKIKILGRGSSNGIDTTYFNPENYLDSFREDFRRNIGIPEMDLIFIFIGRLVSEKGINELISSFEGLQKIYSNISLLLVGPLEEELDPLNPATIKIIEKNPKIYPVGYKQDIRPYLAISHVLAFPSYREGFPNVVMQAGAMGLPSIVSDINGCNEIIQKDKNGIIIPVKNIKALYNAMEYLVNNPEARHDLSKNAREIIATQYDRLEFWKILKNEYKLLEEGVKKE